MGLVQLNADRDGTLPGPLWALLAFTALLCAWCVVPRERGIKRAIMIGLKIAGALGLIALLAIFRSSPQQTEIPFLGRVDNWVWLRTEWWGILGLIGWAYLTAAIVWLVLGRRREWLMAAVAILIWVHLAMRGNGVFARLDTKPWLGWLMPLFQWLAIRARPDRSICQYCGRHRFAGGDLGRRLPARQHPPPRQRRRDSP